MVGFYGRIFFSANLLIVVSIVQNFAHSKDVQFFIIALSDLELRFRASCLFFSKECLQIDAEDVLQRKPFGANDEGAVVSLHFWN